VDFDPLYASGLAQSQAQQAAKGQAN